MLRATFKTWWLRLRKLMKVAHERETRRSHINWISVFLSFTSRKLTVETFWDAKTSAWGKLLVKVIVNSVYLYLYSVKSNFKLSYFAVQCSCFKVNSFVLRREIASRNVSKCSSKISPCFWKPFVTRWHTWLLLKFKQNSLEIGGPECPDKGAKQITSFFSSKYILASKKEICRNDKFYSFFSRCTTARFWRS